MISSRLDLDVIRALFQVAKEFNVIPDADLAQIGTTRLTVDAWTTNLRALRTAVRDHPSGDGSIVQVMDGDLVLEVPQAPGEDSPATPLFIEDAKYFQAVSDHLVSLMGDREIFLRTGFQAAELRDAAQKISELVSGRGGAASRGRL